MSPYTCGKSAIGRTHAVGERVGAGPATVAAMTKAAMAGREKDETGSDLIL